METIWKKKVCVFVIYLRFLKKSDLKLLDRSVYGYVPHV